MTKKSSFKTLAVPTARANSCRARASLPSRIAKWMVLPSHSSYWSKRMAIEVQIKDLRKTVWRCTILLMVLSIEGMPIARFAANSRRMALWDPIWWPRVAHEDSLLRTLTQASKNRITSRSRKVRRLWSTIVAFQSREWLISIVCRTRPTWRTSPPSKCNPSRHWETITRDLPARTSLHRWTKASQACTVKINWLIRAQVSRDTNQFPFGISCSTTI